MSATPSTPITPTEAHHKLAEIIFGIAKLCAHNGGLFREPVAQLIAESEARANRELIDERDQLRAEVEQLKECNRISVQSSIALAKQRDEAESSLSEMIKQSRVDSSVAGIAICNEMSAKARAERAEAELAQEKAAHAGTHMLLDNREAELATERARLDWLDSRRFDHSHHETGEHLGSEWTVSGKSEENTVRAAIDAAMKEGGK